MRADGAGVAYDDGEAETRVEGASSARSTAVVAAAEARARGAVVAAG